MPKLKYILPVMIIALLLGVYFLFSPTQFSFFPACPFYKYTGFHCAGCGSQRALHHLLHLDIVHMLNNNLLLPIWIFLGFDYVYKRWIKKTDPLLLQSWIPWMIFIVLISFMILRNIPYEPFSFLAPVL
ncbi:MAG: hypothetical protein ACI94Y_004314 [Maribacter sp.]|jgi:hypothetical protein